MPRTAGIKALSGQHPGPGASGKRRRCMHAGGTQFCLRTQTSKLGTGHHHAVAGIRERAQAARGDRLLAERDLTVWTTVCINNAL